MHHAVGSWMHQKTITRRELEVLLGLLNFAIIVNPQFTPQLKQTSMPSEIISPESLSDRDFPCCIS